MKSSLGSKIILSVVAGFMMAISASQASAEVYVSNRTNHQQAEGGSDRGGGCRGIGCPPGTYFRTAYSNVSETITNREDFILPDADDQLLKVRFRPISIPREITPVLRFGEDFRVLEWNKVYDIMAVPGPKMLVTGVAKRCISHTEEYCEYRYDLNFDYMMDFLSSDGQLVSSHRAHDPANPVQGWIIRGK